MKKYRPVIAATTALLFYTITDILIWQRIFEANQMIEHADTYHTGWFVSLAGYAALGVFLLWGSWKDCVYYLTTLLIGAFSGMEDVLYYLLDRKPIPASLPWLDSNPLIYDSSRWGLVSSVLFWVVMLVILYFMLYEWRRDRSKSII